MNPFDRRRALQLAVGFLAAPTLFARPAQAGMRSNGQQLPIPLEPMVLTRTLERELVDGNMLAVTRSWQLGFQPAAGGVRVSGKQLSATVSAPDSLAPLARLEQQRIDGSRFPMWLDGLGMIQGTDPAPRSDMLEQALQIAVQRIREAEMPPRQTQAAQDMLVHITRSAGQMLGNMAPDFFFPRQLAWAEERELDLPGGLRGSVEVQFRALQCDDSPMLRQSNREIVTRIGETARKASESWELVPDE
ncbi:MAG: hypothetical protein H6918_03160 [Sphingomonadaceae bacterium]|nr:hypothetical protein [Sphingomonadaceae bacterium]